MKKLTRILTVGGLGLLGALAAGAGPAQAASTHESKPAPRHIEERAEWRDNGQAVGYYRSLQACELTGVFGERNGNWDDHDCTLVRVGYRNGAWALQVASYDNWNRVGFGVPFRAICAFPTQYRPVWVGSLRSGFPGYAGPIHGGPVHGGPIHGGPIHGGPIHGGPVHGGPIHHGPVRQDGPHDGGHGDQHDNDHHGAYGRP